MFIPWDKSSGALQNKVGESLKEELKLMTLKRLNPPNQQHCILKQQSWLFFFFLNQPRSQPLNSRTQDTEGQRGCYFSFLFKQLVRGGVGGRELSFPNTSVYHQLGLSWVLRSSPRTFSQGPAVTGISSSSRPREPGHLLTGRLVPVNVAERCGIQLSPNLYTLESCWRYRSGRAWAGGLWFFTHYTGKASNCAKR